MKKEISSASTSNKILDRDFWEERYQTKTTGWDIGYVSPAIKEYIDSLSDKTVSILIPGCGNTYEASYLLDCGFTNVTVIDIAPTLIEALQHKFASNPNINIVLGDFFEHEEKYDVILEQTFFCTLPLERRQEYVLKMQDVLADDGILAGLLFNRDFDGGPPFGGNKKEYELLFNGAFDVLRLEVSLNSIPERANSELFFEFRKK